MKILGKWRESAKTQVKHLQLLCTQNRCRQKFPDKHSHRLRSMCFYAWLFSKSVEFLPIFLLLLLGTFYFLPVFKSLHPQMDILGYECYLDIKTLSISNFSKIKKFKKYINSHFMRNFFKSSLLLLRKAFVKPLFYLFQRERKRIF